MISERVFDGMAAWSLLFSVGRPQSVGSVLVVFGVCGGGGCRAGRCYQTGFLRCKGRLRRRCATGLRPALDNGDLCRSGGAAIRAGRACPRPTRPARQSIHHLLLGIEPPAIDPSSTLSVAERGNRTIRAPSNPACAGPVTSSSRSPRDYPGVGEADGRSPECLSCWRGSSSYGQSRYGAGGGEPAAGGTIPACAGPSG
jgi:hypothetical protein